MNGREIGSPGITEILRSVGGADRAARADDPHLGVIAAPSREPRTPGATGTIPAIQRACRLGWRRSRTASFVST